MGKSSWYHRARRGLGRQLSVALKMGVPLVLITVVAAALFGWATIREDRSRLNDTYAIDGQGISEQVRMAYLSDPSPMAMTTYLDNLLMTRPSLIRIRLYGQTHGSASYVWMSTNPMDLGFKPNVDDLLLGRHDRVFQEDTTLAGRPVLETIVPLPLGNGVVSMGLYYSLNVRNAAIASATKRTIFFGALAIGLELLALFPAFYLTVLRRLRRLGRVATAVAEGDYSIRLPDAQASPGRDELAKVTREFDRMVTTIGLRTRQQAAVAALGQRALAGGDMPALFDEAADLAATHLGVPFSAILELTDEGALVIQAGRGWGAGVIGFATIEEGEDSQSRRTLASHEPVIMEDRETETRFTPSHIQIENGIISGATVPIPGSERPYGVLAAHTTERRTFTGDDVNFLVALANVLAAGIERKAAEEQVAFMAHHDELTGLPNRVMFEELLELALARARRNEQAVAVLFMDMDNFKLVNDSLGHASGDQLLEQFALRLREATRDTDLVARQGGDEFLILLADVETQTETPLPEGTDNIGIVSESVAVRVQQSLESPFVLGGEEFYASASIGISMFPKDANDARALLKNADAAMYRSKKRGPGGYAIYSSEAEDPGNKLSLTTRLRKAVESRHWILHYQPLVDLESGDMVGVEALLRWQDPNGGIIPPGEFIPLAEEMGLIVAIGDWVMEEICRQSEEWRAKGIELVVGFNVSPRQLWQPDLVDKVLGFLSAGNVAPARVEIEITESSAMTDPERTQRILWDLHARGIRLSIDDFGTGYSSLSRLKHMPVSTLKIDRSFVMDIPDDPDAGNMVSAVIGLAHSLGMHSLAEGIETEQQWRFLQTKGCELGQGYYFSRPVPAPEIEAMFERNGGSNILAEINRRG